MKNGTNDGYESGYNDAIKKLFEDAANPKFCIIELFYSLNHDQTLLKDLFEEFQIHMKIKGLI